MSRAPVLILSSEKYTLSMKKPFTFALLTVAIILALAGCTNEDAQGAPSEVRVAYFANLTHVQPLVGLKLGTFQEELGDVAIKSLTFNAGPSEIEALFAGEVDIGYIGSGPAINGYIKSNGEALRIVAALRYYLHANGLKTSDKGGDVRVISVNNPDILTLFRRKEPDGA
ncbi:MAG: transporter substrate-binding protein [Dehalococcoidia bacterium]|nr:transporter substrate-binding protein [Dehalococcoidia bacterium]